MEGGEYNTRGKPTSGHAPNKSDLISSAKLMADAAKSTLSHNNDKEKIDKAKVAGAAGDLLGAAKHYGKLEEKSFGKYVGKAETYLHQYHSSHSTNSSSSTATHANTAVHGSDGIHGNHSSSGGSGGSGNHSSSGGSGGHSSGGYGEYVKLAQGLLNKKQDHGGDAGTGTGTGTGHSSGGGGAGDYIKLAQGLLNKKDDHGGFGSGHSSGGGAGDYIKLAQGFMKKH